MAFNSFNGANSDGAIGFQFLKVYNLWHNRLKTALNKIDLTHPQFVILTSLGYLQQQHSEVTQVMVSKLAEMDVMTVSQVLRTLERKALVTRDAHSTDTRAKAIFQTALGQDVMNQALPIVEGIDAEVFGALGNDQASFHRELKQLIQAHQKEELR